MFGGAPRSIFSKNSLLVRGGRSKSFKDDVLVRGFLSFLLPVCCYFLLPNGPPTQALAERPLNDPYPAELLPFPDSWLGRDVPPGADELELLDPPLVEDADVPDIFRKTPLKKSVLLYKILRTTRQCRAAAGGGGEQQTSNKKS